MTKTLIKIDVTDWAEEHDRIEADISSEDKLIGLVTRDKVSTPQAARLAIVARERGLAPDDILPANKPLLMTGAAKHISSLIASKHIEAQTPSGNTYSVREFVAPVRDDASEHPEGWGEEEEGQKRGDTQNSDAPSPSPEPESFAPVQSEEGKGWALDYLLKRVPGYIYGRLKIIAVNGGDVKGAADELKNRIDELVMRLG